MSFSILKQIGDAQKKKSVVDIRSGDTIKVTQKIKEGNKFRSQTFEGVVIRIDRKESHTARVVVRKVTSGVGVEKSYLIHSPLVEKIEIVRRAKVRRNNLTYLRDRAGKSARLSNKEFDRNAVNATAEFEAESTEAKSAETEPTKAEPAAVEATKAESVAADTTEASSNDTSKQSESTN